jgi:hypothetical protein
MYMRFNWGLGVGHTYGQLKSTLVFNVETEVDDTDADVDLPDAVLSESATAEQRDLEEELIEDPTLSLSDPEDETDSDEGEDTEHELYSDDEITNII